jgi:hypothetical protein
MFNSGNAATDTTGVQAGDILGWKDGESTKYSGGHVFMSLGGNSIIEVSNPPGDQNADAITNSLSYYQSEVKHIIRLNSSNSQTESFSGVTYASQTVIVTINNYNSNNVHKIMISNNGQSKTIENANSLAHMSGTTANITITLTTAEHTNLKSPPDASVSVWSAGAGLDTKTVTIN